jgi:aldehyde dehydrogenase (NAD+)
MMLKVNNTYINGSFHVTDKSKKFNLVNPANEKVFGYLNCSSAEDVEHAIKTAKQSQKKCASLNKKEKIEILQEILIGVKSKRGELAKAISLEMGAPINLSTNAHINMGIDHLTNTINVLKTYSFEEANKDFKILKVPIGVVGLITPWNWPLNQTLTKISSSIAAGCSIVLKPSEFSALSMKLLIDIIHQSKLPKGGFNVINGIGSELGPILSNHPNIDMISFTGSTEVGIQIQQEAAKSVKKVSLELGGKSAHIICDDVDLNETIPIAINQCFINSGQSCSAPTRLLVPQNKIMDVKEIAKKHVQTLKVGDPMREDTVLGPVVNKKQFNSILNYINEGIDQSLIMICGGLGRPNHLKKGFYIKPTIFFNVPNESMIAQEEIFGPVLTIIGYKDLDDAIAITNNSKYGLSSYISCKDQTKGYKIAKNIQAGQTIINKISRGSAPAPFGGFKMSGNGREHGIYGLEEYLEIKAII